MAFTPETSEEFKYQNANIKNTYQNLKRVCFGCPDTSGLLCNDIFSPFHPSFCFFIFDFLISPGVYFTRRCGKKQRKNAVVFFREVGMIGKYSGDEFFCDIDGRCGIGSVTVGADFVCVTLCYRCAADHNFG